VPAFGARTTNQLSVRVDGCRSSNVLLNTQLPLNSSQRPGGATVQVCGGRLLVAKDGSWYLPVHREPAESWHTFTGKAFHPLSEALEQQLQLASPPGAAAQASRAAGYEV
jgi:hypothetical protein